MDHICKKEPQIEHISDRVDQIHRDTIEVKVELGKLSVISESQSKILENHIKRTEIAEKRLDKLEIPYKLIAFMGIPLGVIATALTILSKFGIF